MHQTDYLLIVKHGTKSESSQGRVDVFLPKY